MGPLGRLVPDSNGTNYLFLLIGKYVASVPALNQLDGSVVRKNEITGSVEADNHMFYDGGVKFDRKSKPIYQGCK